MWDDGKTGKVAFNSAGDRAFAEYEILNVCPRECNNSSPSPYHKPNLQVVGEYCLHKVTPVVQHINYLRRNFLLEIRRIKHLNNNVA